MLIRRPPPPLLAATLAAAALLGQPPVLAAASGPIVERIGELTINYSAGTIAVRGVGAPSLRTPSADIARIEAERKARTDAARRLRAALSTVPRARLGCDDPSRLPGLPGLPGLDAAITAAETREIDWGSDGSVALLLEIPIARLTTADPSGSRIPSRASSEPTGPKAPPEKNPSAAKDSPAKNPSPSKDSPAKNPSLPKEPITKAPSGVDGGAPATTPPAPNARPVLAVSTARPSLTITRGGGDCAHARPAPRVFETLDDLRAAMPEIDFARARWVDDPSSEDVTAIVRRRE